MAKPTKPTPPDRALRSNPSTFSANAEAWITYQWGTFPDYIDNTADFVDEQANAALAAALGGDLPVITGQALKLLRVNAGETAAEFVDPATVVLAEAPELTQVQVENPASTVFGQVSGERLAQAGVVSFTAQEQQIGVGQTWQDVSGSRSASSTSYQNTSGKPISIGLALDNNSGALQMSSDNSTWVTVGSRSGTETNSISAVIPNGYYYRLTGTPSIQSWAELR